MKTLAATAAALALAALSAGCASTGATPRPFPMPGRPSAPSAVPAGIPPAPGSIPAIAMSLRGTPYRNGGTDPTGFDCSGFTRYVFGAHGVYLPRDLREQFKMGKSVKPDRLEPGDLLFFSTTEPGASHVAISLGGDEFIHAPSSKGVVRVERVTSSYWSKRFVGARRVRGASSE